MAISKPEIVIIYCTQCQWLLRAAWLAQELLSTFADIIPVTMIARMIGIPGTPATDLTVQGSGPVDDFTAQLRLATDGQDRLAGTVTVTADSFAADLSAFVRKEHKELKGLNSEKFAELLSNRLGGNRPVASL